MKSYTFTLLFWLVSFCCTAQPAPDFTITSTDNQQHHLYADYLDQGITVVLKLMFVDCPPCNDIAPATQTLYQDWGEGSGDVEFFSLSIRTNDFNSDMLDYEQMHGLTYPGAASDGGGYNATLPYRDGTYGPFFGTPTFVVIAPNGSVNFDVAGAGQSGTIMALDAAIEATGAIRPGSEVFYQLSGTVRNANGQGISDVQVALNDQLSPYITGTNGQFNFQDVASSTQVDIAPLKNINHRNGVTTFDIVNVQKHILRIATLDSPYKMIAADINRSKSITSFDLLLMRKIILVIDTAFTNNTSWRFIPASFTFPNPANPFESNFPESIQIDPLDQNYSQLDFIGLKVGDVNNSADPAALAATDSRSARQMNFNTKDQVFEAGELVSVPFYSSDFQDIIAFQFTLNFDQHFLDFEGLTEEVSRQNIDFGEDNIGINHTNKGMLTFSWNDVKGIDLSSDQKVFQLVFKAKQNGRLSELLTFNSMLTTAEAYTSSGIAKGVELKIQSLEQLTTLPELHPNFINESALLTVELQQPALVELVVTTAGGLSVRKESLGNMEAGRHQQLMNFEQLANGAYFLQFKCNGITQHTLPFVIGR